MFAPLRPRLPLLLAVTATAAVYYAAGSPPPPRLSLPAPKNGLRSAFNRMPLSFAALDEASGAYVSRGAGFSLRVAPHGAEFRVRGGADSERVATVGMELVGADRNAVATPEAALPGRAHYFLGNDPARWRRNVPTFARVRCPSVYPGVDLVYYGNQRELEYDLIVAPGRDPGVVRWRFSGVNEVALEVDGALRLRTPAGDLRQQRPTLYQERNGKRETVSGKYVLTASAAGLPEVGFAVGPHDATRPLVIDPVLSYSTYLGGTGADRATALAVDAGGNAYVAGFTTSADFPALPGAFQTGPGGTGSRGDVFVAKLDPSGSILLSATYVGGGGSDEPRGLALDGDGNAYVTGETDSNNFPTANPLYPSLRGDLDAYLFKLSADGASLVYSTYLGGQGHDLGVGVGVDSFGNAAVVGQTDSTNFPVQNAAQPLPGGAQTRQDAFVTRFSVDGSALIYSTYLGGNRQEMVGEVGGIAVEPNGAAYVAGATSSTDFPVTPNAFDGTLAGAAGSLEGFVTKFSAEGVPVYSTFLGGSLSDTIAAIAVDGSGEACVTGTTSSTDFPTENAEQENYGGGDGDAFVTKLAADGTALVYSTYLGGGGSDNGYALALDASGSAYVAGGTFSTNFPIVRPLQPPAGNYDAFLARVSPAGNLAFSTYLGGASQDTGNGVAVDANGEMYVAGHTLSTAFPTLLPLQATLSGNGDAFVVRVSEGSAPPVFPTGLTMLTVCNTSATLTWADNSDNEDAFEIERRLGAGPFVTVGAVSANVVLFEQNDLSPGSTYTFRVRATNGDGASSYSNEVTVTTLVTTVAPPSGLAVAVIDHAQLKLTWTDNSADEVGFRIERSTDGGLSFARVQTLAANTVEFTDTGLTPATAYTYRVRSTSAGCDSTPSPTATASTKPQPVTPPTLLTARALSDTEIGLAWKDNSNNETGFKIERAQGTDGAFAALTVTAADVTAYTDTNLGSRVVYRYRVSAVNGTAVSEATAEAKTTTLSPPTGTLKVAKKVDFGKVKLGETKTKVLTIRNSNRVERMRLTVGTVLDPYTIAGSGTSTVLIGGTRSVTLKFTPTSTGKFTTKLVLLSSDPKHGRVEVALTGTGRAAPARSRKK